MADKKIIMTQEGLDKLKTKLEYLKTVKRYEVADRIKVARGYGDLSENSEYDEAKTEQGFVEGEIAELEERLKNAEVVPDEDIHTDDVSVGSVVKIRDLDDDEIEEYKIVGSTESNLKENKLSNASPVGAGLIGAKVGEIETIKVPNGEVKYEILGIRR